MHSPTDITLLQRWQEHQDAHAFKALTQRYGGLVFAISRRVLRNAADAEEITQECFLKLAQNPEKQERSLGPWLHAVAVRMSLNHLRTEQRRKQREVDYSETRPQSVEPKANDLLEHVDEAINELPDELRRCVVEYFLAGKSQGDVAADLGISTRTVRRRTDEAITQIRKILEQRGITARAGVLASTLAGLKAEALAPELTISLGKIAVGGKVHTGPVGIRAAAEKTATGGMNIMKGKIMAAAGVLILSGAAWWFTTTQGPGPATETIPATSQPRLPADPSATVVAATPDPPSPPTSDNNNDEPISETTPAIMGIEDIQPIANPNHYAQLTGAVLDESGRPMVDVAVTLVVAGVPQEAYDQLHVAGLPDMRPAESDRDLARWSQYTVMDATYALPDHRLETRTDETGRYHFPAIKFAGKGVVAATAEGYALTQRSLELTENQVSEVDITLVSGSTLRGRILTATGTPVVGARVGAFSVTHHAQPGSNPIVYSGPPKKGPSASIFMGGPGKPKYAISFRGPSIVAVATPFQAQTDSKGEFKLPLAPADFADLLVVSDTFGTEVFPGVPVGDEEIVELTWTTQLGALDGQLLRPDAEPAANHYLFLAGTINGTASTEVANHTTGGSVEGSRYYIQTDGAGRFHLEGLPTQEDYLATFYDRAGRKVGVATPPPLIDNGTTPWKHQLAPTLQITGRVVGAPSGNVIAGARIAARPVETSAAALPGVERALSEKDGTFQMNLFGEDGDCDIVATLHPALQVLWENEHAQRVSVRLGEATEVTLEIPDPCSRRFRVVDPVGRPVAGAAIKVRQHDEERGAFIDDVDGVTTDSTGRFASEPVSADVSTTFTFSHMGYIDGVSTESLGSPGLETAEEVVVLYPIASATARLLDETGSPLASTDVLCTVRYAGGQRATRRVATDESGWLVLADWLPATDVSLSVRLPISTPEGPFGRPSGVGSVSSYALEEVTESQLVQAEAVDTPSAQLLDVELVAGTDNALGDIVLLPAATE